MSFTMSIDDTLEDNANYKNQQGNHECVEFVRQGTGAPNTSTWKKGQQVISAQLGAIPSGTAIATFDSNNKYPSSNRHAAVYVSHTPTSITVFDQWNSQGKVKKRVIRAKVATDIGVNNALNYYVIEN